MHLFLRLVKTIRYTKAATSRKITSPTFFFSLKF